MALSKKHQRWKPDELALLGTISDAAASDILDRDRQSIESARVRRGISSFHAKRKINKWCNDDLTVFDQYDNVTIGKLLRLKPFDVAYRRAELRGIG